MSVNTEPPIIDRTDGVSLEFPHWRFNLRCSNTEPLLRLNIETKGNKALLTAKMSEIEQLITSSTNNPGNRS